MFALWPLLSPLPSPHRGVLGLKPYITTSGLSSGFPQKLLPAESATQPLHQSFAGTIFNGFWVKQQISSFQYYEFIKFSGTFFPKEVPFSGPIRIRTCLLCRAANSLILKLAGGVPGRTYYSFGLILFWPTTKWSKISWNSLFIFSIKIINAFRSKIFETCTRHLQGISLPYLVDSLVPVKQNSQQDNEIVLWSKSSSWKSC